MKLVGIGVPDAAPAWERIGCRVIDRSVPLANGALLLGDVGLVVADAAERDLEGIPVRTGSGTGTGSSMEVVHPNGATELDHLVVLTDDLERTSAAVEVVLGLPCRRIRETGQVRQAFHRFADTVEVRGCIVEIVEQPTVPPGTATLMGVVLVIADLDGLAGQLGPDVVSPPKAAVQAGRSISTVRREVGLGTAVALMSPAR